MLEKVYISKCLLSIEQKLQWASREKWVYDDFKHLQSLIFDASSINLSIHTLERLFGKLKTQENYNPQAETKNALALFLGYKSWNHYKSENKLTPADATPPPTHQTQPETAILITADADRDDNDSRSVGVAVLTKTDRLLPHQPVRRSLARIVVGIVLGCLGLAALFWYSFLKTTPAINFGASNAYGRVPHTVKFSYAGPRPNENRLYADFGGETAWKINGERASFFRTYMQPGIFDVYLKQDSLVLAATKVFIDTDGWQGYAYRNYEDATTRVLLPNSSLRADQRLYTNPELLTDSIRRSLYFVEYNIVRDFGVDGDNVTLDTRFRSTVANGGRLCNDMWFKLTGTRGVLKMHFLVVGCAGYTQMIFGERNLDGHVQDLSAFAKDFSNWQTARMSVANKYVSLYFGDHLIYLTDYTNSIGRIMAISVTSKGSGETDYVKLYDGKKKLVFADDFK